MVHFKFAMPTFFEYTVFEHLIEQYSVLLHHFILNF